MIYENDSRHLPKLENAFTGHRKITGAMLVPIELLTEKKPCITFIKSSWFKTKRALSRLFTAPAGRGVKRRVSDDEMKRAVLHFYAGLELCFLGDSLQSLSGNLVLTLSFGWIFCMVNVFHSNVRVDMLVSYSFWSKVDNEVRCSYEAIPDQHWNLNRQLLETTVLATSMVT